MATVLLALAQGIVLESSIDPEAPPHREVGQQFVMLLLAVRQDAQLSCPSRGPTAPKNSPAP